MLFRLKKFLNLYGKWILFSLSILIIIALAIIVSINNQLKFDNFIYNIISKLSVLKTSTPFFKFITFFGGTIFLISLTIIMFFIFMFLFKDKKLAIIFVINSLFSALLNLLLKNIIQRPRPIGFRLIEISGYSFPSGHSMSSLAIYGFFIYLIFNKIKNKPLKWSLISFLSLLILTIGISRIYLGVHFATDVIAGLLTSLSSLIIIFSIFKDKLQLTKNTKTINKE